MGWRGVLRSVNAAARAAERDYQRHQKQALKEQMLEDAADAVDAWEDYIHEITSVHEDRTESIDWNLIAKRPKPVAKPRQRTNELNAQATLDRFKPGIFDFFHGGSTKRFESLLSAVDKGKSKDAEDFEEAQKEYAADLEDWEISTGLARKLLSQEAGSLRQAIKMVQSERRDEIIGSLVSFTVGDDFVHAVVKVQTDEIVPSFRRKQLASGRMSESKMPLGQFYELYQDYVTSMAIRTGRDVFSVLPLDEVYVSCITNMLNTATGHKEITPILSVMFVRRTLDSLSHLRLDPSDSMRNFTHVVKFKKTKGFEPIEPLKPVF